MRRCGRSRSRRGLLIVSIRRGLGVRFGVIGINGVILVKIEYFERLGEGSIFREGYLGGGKKMD
jgi:hypothetical protein